MALFCDSSAWGAFQHLAADAFRKAVGKGAIFDVYQKFWHGNELGWWKVSAGFCPDQSNKYACYYLPMTNCTKPAVLAECKTEECMQKLMKRGSSVFYSSGTAGATLMTDKQVNKEVLSGSEYWIPFYAHPQTKPSITDRVREWQTQLDGFVGAPLWNSANPNGEPFKASYQPYDYTQVMAMFYSKLFLM